MLTSKLTFNDNRLQDLKSAIINYYKFCFKKPLLEGKTLIKFATTTTD